MQASERQLARRRMRRRPTYFSGIYFSSFSGVLLVLLYLFMNGPYHRYGPPVDLSTAHHFELEPHALREDAISVSVTRDGRVFFRETDVGLDKLPGLILGSVKQGSEKTVYLSVDLRARNSDVKAVMQQIELAGISSITIMTNQPVPSDR